jgi:hypothetical protein
VSGSGEHPAVDGSEPTCAGHDDLLDPVPGQTRGRVVPSSPTVQAGKVAPRAVSKEEP